jgi:hypothetical protein
MLALTGCGLADYEKKMQDAEVRVQRFDEENRLLGAPLTFPADPAPPMEVFLRPPKGVAKSPDAAKDQPQYHFPGSSGVCTDMLVMFGSPKDGKDQVEKQVEDRLSRVALTWQPVEIHPPERTQAIAFDAVEFFDPLAPANAPAVFVAYVHQPAGQPAAAIVFRLLQANRSGADEVLKKCLETYAEMGDSLKARAAFAARSAR